MSPSSTSTPGDHLPILSDELHDRLVQLLKLLADDKRLRIVLHLAREGELHVSHLCDRLEQSQPAVSHHLAVMRDAGLIARRRDGKHNYYAICPELFHDVLNGLFELFDANGRSTVRFAGIALQRVT